MTDEVANETEKNVTEEKPAGEEDAAAEGNKETPANEAEEKEPEDKVINGFKLLLFFYYKLMMGYILYDSESFICETKFIYDVVSSLLNVTFMVFRR